MKRFELNFYEDKVNDIAMNGSYDLRECCELLNEQQAIISSLQTELELIANTKLFSRKELERKVEEQQAEMEKLEKKVKDKNLKWEKF